MCVRVLKPHYIAMQASQVDNYTIITIGWIQLHINELGSVYGGLMGAWGTFVFSSLKLDDLHQFTVNLNVVFSSLSQFKGIKLDFNFI